MHITFRTTVSHSRLHDCNAFGKCLGTSDMMPVFSGTSLGGAMHAHVCFSTCHSWRYIEISLCAILLHYRVRPRRSAESGKLYLIEDAYFQASPA